MPLYPQQSNIKAQIWLPLFKQERERYGRFVAPPGGRSLVNNRQIQEGNCTSNIENLEGQRVVQTTDIIKEESEYDATAITSKPKIYSFHV
jgi:hypothetical protein